MPTYALVAHTSTICQPSPATFTIAQFKTLVTAIVAFVSGCVKCINGQPAALPSSTVNIP